MEILVSLIIPAYNEEKRIGKTLETILSYLSKKKFNSEIIVVDDGSKDSTTAVVEKTFAAHKPEGSLRRSSPATLGSLRLIRSEKNMGKGHAVRTGILSAAGSYIYFTDADLSTPVEELENFLEKIKQGKYDVVIGSRSISGSNIVEHQPFYRELMGKTFNKLVRIFCLGGFVDTQCGAKMFTGEAAKKVFSIQKLDGFAFDVEALYIAKKLGMKIYEMPVTWINSAASRVSVFKDSMRMFLDVLKIRSLHKGNTSKK